MADFRVTGADGAPLDDDTLTRPAGHALPGGSDVARTPAYEATAPRVDDVVIDDPDQARAAIERTRSRMSETIDSIEEVLLRKKEQIQEKMDVLAPVKHNPLPAAGAVFGVGLVLGLLTGGGRKHELEYDGPREGMGPDLAAERRWRQRHASLQAKHRELEAVVKEQRAELKQLRKDVKRSGGSGRKSRKRSTGYETETVRYDRDLRYGGTTSYGADAASGGTSSYGTGAAYGGTVSYGGEGVLDSTAQYEGITAYGDTGYTDDAMDATTLYDRDELYDGTLGSEQDTAYGTSSLGGTSAYGGAAGYGAPAYGAPEGVRATGYGNVYDRDQAEYRYEDLDDDDVDDDGAFSAMGDAVTSLKETVLGGITGLVSDAFGRFGHHGMDVDNEQDRVINPT